MKISWKMILLSFGLSVLFVIYSMNFIPRNIAIMAERTLSRQIFNYAVNILLFFVVIYLILSLLVWIYKKILIKNN